MSRDERRSGSVDRFRSALALAKPDEDDGGVRVPGGVGEVEAPELLEREQQLGALSAALGGVAERGAGLVVLVHGEAGIGKTVLVRRFCGQAGGSVRVLWATCDPLFTPRPLGPLFDIARVSDGEMRELIEAGGQPHEVAHALMDELDGRSSSVVVVEDLHWAMRRRRTCCGSARGGSIRCLRCWYLRMRPLW